MMLRNALAATITVAAICCFTGSDKLMAASTAGSLTYTASGTFAATPVSGADTLKLAGEPFSVTITVSAATKPYKTGSNWAAYNKLKLTGSVHSGLLGATPVNIASTEASITQAIAPGTDDTFTMQAPVKVVGISLTLKAQVAMPLGTIGKPLLSPFSAPVKLAPGNATLTYSDGTATTVVAMESGTLTAKEATGAAQESAVELHSGGAQAVTMHGDGTVSMRPIGAAPIDLGFTADAVTLRFYASGVSGASEVHVQIAGEEVPVLYAGASGYFPGLDEVMVQAPSSLAGRGATDVTLTADGQTAEPVRIHIQ
jgi:uncharacterized protein (TIGR03437 family)